MATQRVVRAQTKFDQQLRSLAMYLVRKEGITREQAVDKLLKMGPDNRRDIQSSKMWLLKNRG